MQTGIMLRQFMLQVASVHNAKRAITWRMIGVSIMTESSRFIPVHIMEHGKFAAIVIIPSQIISFLPALIVTNIQKVKWIQNIVAR